MHRCDSYLFIFKAFLQVTVPQAGDVTYVLFGESRNLGREVIRECQFNQLRCCGQDSGGIVGRRRFFFQICVGKFLKRGVRHSLEEVVQGGVLFQLSKSRRK